MRREGCKENEESREIGWNLQSCDLATLYMKFDDATDQYCHEIYEHIASLKKRQRRGSRGKRAGWDDAIQVRSCSDGTPQASVL